MQGNLCKLPISAIIGMGFWLCYQHLKENKSFIGIKAKGLQCKCFVSKESKCALLLGIDSLFMLILKVY